MSRLAITAELLGQLRSELLAHQDETCAVLFGRAVMTDGSMSRIVVHEAQWPSADDYLDRTHIRAELRPELVAAATQRARQSGESIVFVHSHPFSLNEFSTVDDHGEKRLADFLKQRTPSTLHAAMLITPQAIVARILGTDTPLTVVGVGKNLDWGQQETGGQFDEAQFDRQMRVFGTAGQSRLSSLSVGIVGLGGTGSIILEHLAHLGVGRFLLIDPDTVEPTNLNRLVGATKTDVGRSKVEVARDLAHRINPSAIVQSRVGSVLLDKTAKLLADVDFIFSCTDTHGSRAVLNQLAYQYLIPLIDMGVVIVPSKRGAGSVAGRTQMLAPGLACLLCGNLLNPEAVRVDLLTDFERQRDPYVVGVHEPAPSVISLNSTMASLAVTMFLSAAVGIPGTARLVNYDAIAGTLRPAAINPHPNCIVCSENGALGRATEWPLPARLS